MLGITTMSETSGIPALRDDGSVSPPEGLLGRLRRRATALTAIEPDAFKIRFVSDASQWFSPHSADLGYFDRLLVVATEEGTGAAFCPHRGDVSSCSDVLGRDSRAIESDHICVEIAALDAAFGSVPCDVGPDLETEARGSTSLRGDLRASLVAGEVQRLGAESVVMVGAVGSVLAELAERGIATSAVDMDPDVIGETLAGATVLGADRGLELIERSDAAVITGMALTTETTDLLLAAARSSGTEVVMFCQTGSNFAPAYLEESVAAIVTETYPFYMIPGMTSFRVYRKK
jgi:hypothetical protein